MNTYFQGMWRMDWGLGNPNKTAALIALLMIAVWSIAYLRKWGFWAALAFFTILGICLIHTASRGGIVALGIGVAAVLWTVPRPWPIHKITALVVSFWVIVGTSIYLETYIRYGQGITHEDPSIKNRIELWKTAPTMMVDAPNGWGIGNSGQAYLQWYQPLNRHEAYRTLVNSHLTWLVEFGWPLRFLYIFTWFLILILCWPMSNRSWSAIPFGIWIAFFVASCFSSVAESIWLWIIPLISLAVVLVDRYIHRKWLQPAVWMLPFLLSGTILIILLILGVKHQGLIIKGSVDRVIIGNDAPKTWIILNPKVVGTDYGRALRAHLPSSGIGLVYSVKALSEMDGDKIILCGGLPQNELHQFETIISHFKQVLLINPSYYPKEIKIDAPSKIQVIFGEFSQSPSIDAWESFSGKPIPRLNGKGDFIPQWPLLISSSDKPNTL